MNHSLTTGHRPLTTSHMPQRIFEQYAPGDRVEITFPDEDRDAWQPAEVLRREPPGIWVLAADGREWFMTNTYRIRHQRNDKPQITQI